MIDRRNFAPSAFVALLLAVALGGVVNAAEEPLEAPASESPHIDPWLSPSLSDAAHASPWGMVDPADIPFRYSCDGWGPFRAVNLIEGRTGQDLEPAILSGFPIIYEDAHTVTLGQFVVGGPYDADEAFRYQRYRGASDGWDLVGWGGCQPRATFPGVHGRGGYWQLDLSHSMPNPQSRRIHLDVWYLEDCHSGVRLQGPPRVHMTDNAVFVAVPVRAAVSTDMCLPAAPERVTVRLPSPLGLRQLFDAGTLPPRPVGPAPDPDIADQSS